MLRGMSVSGLEKKMQDQESEFKRTIKRLKTEIEKPDFKPFKQVKEQKVRLKKTRISKKPLEYMGSGIGTSSAQMIKNSKKFSVFKNIDSLISPVAQKSTNLEKDAKNGNLKESNYSVFCSSGDSRFSFSVSTENEKGI